MWRIVNAGVSRYFQLRLDGQQLQPLRIDSGRFQKPVDVEALLMIPGNPADLLVTTAAGGSVLRSTCGTMPGMVGNCRHVGPRPEDQNGSTPGDTALSRRIPVPLKAVAARTELDDLRSSPAALRQLALGMGVGRMCFTMNGRAG